MSDERRSPEANSEVPGGGSEVPGGTPEAPGGRWLTIAEAARVLDMSERSARDWVKRHDLPLTEGRPVRVAEAALLAQLGREGRVPRRLPEAGSEVPGGSPEVPGGTSKPIEGAYRVTPDLVAQAIARTGQQYTADLRAMLGELRQVYEGQIAAKDETIAAVRAERDELRRRAEAAEAERDALRARESPTMAVEISDAANAYPARSEGLRARLGRWWRGEG